MGAATKLINEQLLAAFEPFRNAHPTVLRKIATFAHLQNYNPGEQIFRKGDHDRRLLLLVSGTVALHDDPSPVLRIRADSDPGRQPLGDRQPRAVTATADSDVSVLDIDRELLELLVRQGELKGAACDSGELHQDWITRFLHAKQFIQLPASTIQTLLLCMEEVSFGAGETVIHQGDCGDYYYLIREGRCTVTRRPQPDSQPITLAQLTPGDGFGEAALITGQPRLATVRMAEDGRLMRLSRYDFIAHLATPVLRFASYTEALRSIADGAFWMDVRTPEEHEADGLDGSLNIPLALLRQRLSKLDRAKLYITYCDTASQSAAAAFMMAQHNFDVIVLDGGMRAVSKANQQEDHIPADAIPTLTDAVRMSGLSGQAAADETQATSENHEALEHARRELEQQMRRAHDADAARQQAERELARWKEQATRAHELAEQNSRRYVEAETARKTAEAEIATIRGEMEERNRAFDHASANGASRDTAPDQAANRQANAEAEAQISRLVATIEALEHQLKKESRSGSQQNNSRRDAASLMTATPARDDAETQLFTQIKFEPPSARGTAAPDPAADRNPQRATQLGWVSDNYLWETVLGYRSDPKVEELLVARNPEQQNPRAKPTKKDSESQRRDAASASTANFDTPNLRKRKARTVFRRDPPIDTGKNERGPNKRAALKKSGTKQHARGGNGKYLVLLAALIGLGVLQAASPEHVRGAIHWTQAQMQEPWMQELRRNLPFLDGIFGEDGGVDPDQMEPAIDRSGEKTKSVQAVAEQRRR